MHLLIGEVEALRVYVCQNALPCKGPFHRRAHGIASVFQQTWVTGMASFVDSCVSSMDRHLPVPAVLGVVPAQRAATESPVKQTPPSSSRKATEHMSAAAYTTDNPSCPPCTHIHECACATRSCGRGSSVATPEL